jgi:PAS domain S-box-containing protein
MEQDVAAREQEYRSLAETSPDFIIRYDREGRILYVNDLLQKRLGLAGAQDVIGKRPREVWPDGRLAQIEKAAARAVANASQVDIELAEHDASGAPRFSQLFIVPERDVNGHIVGTISFGRDITAIRESERRLKHFIESLPGMAYTFKRSANGHASFPYASPAIAEIYGLKPEDVKDDMTPIHLLAHPDDRPRIEAAIAESERTMTPLRVESRICRPGQPERWVDVRSVPEKQPDGSILRHGIMLDITERKRIESTLYFIAQRGWQDSAENFFDALAQYLGETLGVEHVIIDKLTDTLGIVETVALYAKGSIVANIRYELTGTPCENVMMRKFCCHQTGVQNLFPDDTMLAEMGAESYAGLPLWDSTGQPIGLIAVLDSKPLSDEGEISSVLQLVAIRAAAELERARSDHLLRESEREFRTLAENLPDVLVRYDRQGRRTYVNHSLARNFSVIPEQLIGKTLEETDASGVQMPEIYRNALKHTLTTGERSEFEMQMPLHDGSTGTGLCFLVAERAADGQIMGAISIGHDITERNRNQAELERHRHHLEKLVEERTHALSIAKETAEAATRAKSHFLAAASHDLRQPLQAIGLFNQALTMTSLDERQVAISNNLTKSVNCLSELLNKLLDLSRLDAGIIQPYSVVIPATDLLEMIQTEFDAVCQKKGLRLRLFCSQRGLTLFSDLNLLMTLVRNLVSNAHKYTAHGGVLVSIRKRRDRALIQVWDTGIGIAPGLMDSIFEEYFQISNPQRDRTKGVGLGLTIVKRLSNLLRLDLRVRSRVGKGSVFELGVPLANQSNTHVSADASATRQDAVSPTYLLGKQFVVVEDDAPAAESIRVQFKVMW